MTKDELVEELARIVHESWARYMGHFLLKLPKGDGQRLIIPLDYLENLRKLIFAAYDTLTEEEKQKDRDEVYEMLPFISEYASKRMANLVHLTLGMPAHNTLGRSAQGEVQPTESFLPIGREPYTPLPFLLSDEEVLSDAV